MQTHGLTDSAKSKKLFSFFEIVVLGFLFLAAMNFVNRYFYCVFLAFFVFVVAFWNKTKIDLDIVPFIVLAFSMICFSPMTTSLTSLIKPFSYLLCYLMGKNFICEYDGDTEKSGKRIQSVLLVFAMGTFIHMVLNLISNIGNEDASRNTIDFWVGATLSATGQAALGCMAVGVSVALICSQRKFLTKLLSLAILITVLYYNLILAGRTLLFMTAAAILAAVIFLLSNRTDEVKKYKPLIFLALLVVAVIVLYQTNTFGLKDTFEDSNFYNRFFDRNSAEEFSRDSRFDNKLHYLENFQLSLFGGNRLKAKFGYAHDVFLDTYDDSGIFALIAVIIFIISSIRVAVRFIKNKNFSFNVRQLVLCFYLVIYMEFMVEPIIAGMPWLLSLFCFVHGLLKSSMQLKQPEEKLAI